MVLQAVVDQLFGQELKRDKIMESTLTWICRPIWHLISTWTQFLQLLTITTLAWWTLALLWIKRRLNRLISFRFTRLKRLSILTKWMTLSMVSKILRNWKKTKHALQFTPTRTNCSNCFQIWKDWPLQALNISYLPKMELRRTNKMTSKIWILTVIWTKLCNWMTQIRNSNSKTEIPRQIRGVDL